MLRLLLLRQHLVLPLLVLEHYYVFSLNTYRRRRSFALLEDVRRAEKVRGTDCVTLPREHRATARPVVRKTLLRLDEWL